METEDVSKKTLIEQIYVELFANIEKHDEFDKTTITSLKQIAAKGELKKHAKAIEAIKELELEKDETARTGN
jgi:hypothetical protein